MENDLGLKSDILKRIEQEVFGFRPNVSQNDVQVGNPIQFMLAKPTLNVDIDEYFSKILQESTLIIEPKLDGQRT